jgi:hypothetical protein
MATMMPLMLAISHRIGTRAKSCALTRSGVI